MQVIPAAPRHTLVDNGQSLTFSIPSHRQWPVVLFIGFWCIGWLFGEITVLGGLLSGKGGGGLFMVAWLGGWTIGGALAIFQMLWQLAGRELLVVSSDAITITRQIFNLGFSKMYATEHIKDLRSTAPVRQNQWSRSFWNQADSTIAFDYGAKTIRFASGIDEAEGKQIVEIIRRRYPSLA